MITYTPQEQAVRSTLLTTLQLAVPLHIAVLATSTVEERIALAKTAADVIASQGDLLQFKGSKPGKTAAVFNALARGLAAAAYQPGGVTFLGQHWCTDHVLCTSAEAQPGPSRRPISDVHLPE
jgi:hypothetical protein